MTADSSTIPLLLTAGPLGSESLNLRFPPEYADEIRTLLDEHGLEHSTAAEFAAGPQLAIEALHVGAQWTGAAGGVGGLAVALASVYKTFAHRHDGKHVSMSKDGDIDVNGYSREETEQIIRNQLAEQEKRDAEWFRSIEPEPEDQ